MAEKNEASNAVEKLLSREIVNCPLVTCIEFNPITEKKVSSLYCHHSAPIVNLYLKL